MWRKIMKSAKQVEIIPGEMIEMDIDTISLVHKGANKQKIQIYKEESEDTTEEEDEKQGLFEVLKSYFAGKARKAEETGKKTQKTFAGMMAVNDITENMWRANDTLRTVMRDIMNNAEIVDKKASLLQAIEEYATYMKSKVNTTSTIAKGDPFFDIPETEIEKKKEEKGLKKEDIAIIIKESLKPIKERLDKIEKAEEDSEAEESSKEQEDIAEVIKSVFKENLESIESRLEKVEKSRGIARSLEGEEQQKGKIEKESNTFDGFFI